MITSNVWSKLLVALIGALSLVSFLWPFFISVSAGTSQAALAQTAFMLLMPAFLLLIVSQYSSGGIDSRQLAMLGVLIALNTVVRMLGAGTSGIETAFFLIIIGGYVFGTGFGFLLGAGSLLISGIISGGVGPWLPFQMMAAGLVGLGAGLLPKLPKARVAVLMVYAVIASFGYGALMTSWNWPFLAGLGTSIGYVPGGGLLTNLGRFFSYQVLTGGLLWDAGRAVTTVILLRLTAPALLATLGRAARRAGFDNVK
jgi:energy-coupling factor transport system substrate-specific component